MPKSRSLPQIRISEPCTQNWNEMNGDARSRFCDTCQKKVHNLNEMDGQEVQALLSSGERICARVQSRQDGTVMTRHAAVRRTLVSRLGSLAAVAVACVITGCSREPPNMIMGGLMVDQVDAQMMGEVSVEPTPHQAIPDSQKELIVDDEPSREQGQ